MDNAFYINWDGSSLTGFSYKPVGDPHEYSDPPYMVYNGTVSGYDGSLRVAVSTNYVTVADADYNPSNTVNGAITLELAAVPLPGALPLLGSVLAAGAFAAARRRKG